MHTHTPVVLDFGAVGDGTTDNVQAFQNALNAAVAGGTGKNCSAVIRLLQIVLVLA